MSTDTQTIGSCKHCSMEFTLKRKGHLFCSKDCYHVWRMENARQKGFCLRCRTRLAVQGVYCSRCKFKEQTYYEDKKFDGLCIKCVKHKQDDGYVDCSSCRKKMNRDTRRYYHFRKSLGVCVTGCGREASQGRTRCIPCGVKGSRNAMQRYHRSRRKLQTIGSP